MRATNASVDGAASVERAPRWLLAVAAAGVLIGWQLVRRGRMRMHSRAAQHDLHRWEGEGGQVID